MIGVVNGLVSCGRRRWDDRTCVQRCVWLVDDAYYGLLSVKLLTIKYSSRTRVGRLVGGEHDTGTKWILK